MCIRDRAKSYTLGINAHKTSGTAAFAKLRHIKQTSQPTNAKQEESTRIQLDLGYQQGLFNGLLKVSGSVFKLDEEVADNQDTKTSFQASWEYRF